MIETWNISFIHPQWFSTPCVESSFAPGNHDLFLTLYFSFSRTLCKWNHTGHTPEFDFHITKFIWFIHIVTDEQQSIDRHNGLCINSLTEGQLSFYNFGKVLKILACSFLCKGFYFSLTHTWLEMLLNSRRNHLTLFQRACVISHFCQQWKKVQVVLHLCSIFLGFGNF
jgi:hypothetical protein